MIYLNMYVSKVHRPIIQIKLKNANTNRYLQIIQKCKKKTNTNINTNINANTKYKMYKCNKKSNANTNTNMNTK